MRFLSAAGFCLLFTVLSTGCRCGGLDDASGDLIDTLTERRLSLDCLYKPGLDLSRIGKPDWCRSPLTRLLCRDKCCGSCGNSCQSGCYQAGTPCAQSTTCDCASAGNQVYTADGVAEKYVPVQQSTWNNKTVPISEATLERIIQDEVLFEELPPPDEKKNEQPTL